MLQSISIRNYALIDKLEVHFAPGLNILTGETGAGKSILVGAIGLVLGRRAEAGVLLDQTQKCIVEAEFTVDDPQRMGELLREQELEEAAENLPLLIIRREIAPGGKSRAFINDSPATLNALKAVTALLVDLHGQHEGQQLMEPAEQLAVLDQYASNDPLKRKFAVELKAFLATNAELAELRKGQAEALRQLEYYSYRLEELTQARLKPDEDTLIEQELKLLEHAELIQTTLGRNINLLQEDEFSLSSQLGQAIRELEKLSAIDGRLSNPVSRLGEVKFTLTEVAAELTHLMEGTDLEPARLAALNDRLGVINKLKQKFAARTVAELLSLQAELTQSVEGYAAAPERIAALEQQHTAEKEALVNTGLMLEARRAAVAAELQGHITTALHTIGLPKAELQINLARTHSIEGILDVEGKPVNAGLSGFNSATFLIRTNAGLPLAPLASVASGGEVSRVMLAIKTALAGKLALGTLIFDEIDTGISGEVALKVGRMMEQLGAGHQLLTITHLPQIASRRGAHYLIYKTQEAGRSYTRIKALQPDERIEEIAKMISGENPSSTARESAKELVAGR